MSIKKNSKYIVNDWLKLNSDDRFLIITNSEHLSDAIALKDEAEAHGVFTVILAIPKHSTQIGTFFNSIHDTLFMFTVIMGATEYSLITNKAVLDAVNKGVRFLSFPMSTNNGESVLTFDFLEMDYRKSIAYSEKILPYLDKCDTITVKTAAGTDLTFSKKGRKAGCFAGVADKPGAISSSSFEVYVPIVETATEGTAILDGSFGYLGKVKENVTLKFSGGRLVSIEDNKSGHILGEYLKSFKDHRIYHAAEFGIGLNEKAKCNGNCYIEDESAYGTFHIGMGRNIALGGNHNAKGHFDLVFHSPTIWAGDECIIKDGKIIK